MAETIIDPQAQEENCPVCSKKPHTHEVNQSNGEKHECTHHKDMAAHQHHSHEGCCGSHQCGCGNH